MPTIFKRNFFSDTVAHPGGAVTLAALLRIGGWGLNPDGSKSADSFTGDNVQFIPTGDAYVGWEDTTDATDVLAAAGQPFNVTAWCRGVVATDDVYVYSLAGQDIQLIFQSV
jgi:hypothetical protein